MRGFLKTWTIRSKGVLKGEEIIIAYGNALDGEDKVADLRIKHERRAGDAI